LDKQYLKQYSKSSIFDSTFYIEENVNASNQPSIHSFASNNNFLKLPSNAQSLAETSFILDGNDEFSYIKFTKSEPKLKSYKSANEL
jgi:hypothetical protein